MTTGDQKVSGNAPIPARTGSALVQRSDVSPGKPYREYKQHLRYDFIFSCAYCTMSEAEAQGIRMTIDHYEPRKSRPDLENAYENLMYACDECNMRKGDRCPPAGARENGYRFFRPDQDVHEDHFRREGMRIEHKSNLGYYSIETLDLNRQQLRRLREIRERLTKCDRLVDSGVLGFRNFPIDRLPPAIRGRALQTIRDATAQENRIADRIDELLSHYASSPLLGPDTEAERTDKVRTTALKSMEALFPGSWRAPRQKRR